MWFKIAMEIKNNNAVPKQGAINVFISTLGISHAANGEFLLLIVQQFQMYQKMLAIDGCLTETRQLRFPNTARGRKSHSFKIIRTFSVQQSRAT